MRHASLAHGWSLLASAVAMSFNVASLAGPVPVLSVNGLPEQSPIDIRREDVRFQDLPDLNFDYDPDVALEVVNTGSPGEETTIRANVPSGAGSLTLDNAVFELLQFHFHVPAEHAIDGRLSAMEFHAVHQANDGTLLVVGRFIEAGNFNPTLAPIFNDLPQTAGEVKAVAAFDLNGLLPANLASFRYPGSLTTPPFTEGLLWNILTEPLAMSHEQIAAFSGLFPEGDARELQGLNGRVILTDDVRYAGASVIPLPRGAYTGMIILIASGVLMSVRRLRRSFL